MASAAVSVLWLLLLLLSAPVQAQETTITGTGSLFDWTLPIQPPTEYYLHTSENKDFRFNIKLIEKLREGSCLKVVRSELVIIPCGCAKAKKR